MFWVRCFDIHRGSYANHCDAHQPVVIVHYWFHCFLDFKHFPQGNSGLKIRKNPDNYKSTTLRNIVNAHLSFVMTARKRSLGQGNVFTGVCLFTGGGFPACITGHMTRGVCIQEGGSASRGVCIQEGGLPIGGGAASRGILHLGVVG